MDEDAEEPAPWDGCGVVGGGGADKPAPWDVGGFVDEDADEPAPWDGGCVVGGGGADEPSSHATGDGGGVVGLGGTSAAVASGLSSSAKSTPRLRWPRDATRRGRTIGDT